ncbi:MAG: ABC transporter permease [bacterium]
MTLKVCDSPVVNSVSDSISKFKPELISVIGNIAGEETRLLAYKNTDEAKAIIKDNIRIISGNQEKAFSKEGVMLSKKTAEILNLSVGDEFYYHYQSKYRGEYSENFSIDAIYESSDKLGGNVLLVNEEKIHKTYNKYLPADTDWNYITQESSLYASMATEWKLLDRSANSQELALKYKEMRQTGSDQFVFNLVTMYEGASDIMRMESVLNLITVVVVMILFFIILIGVINTLRMTIKERTREIGTVRAIGMQKKDIRNQFIMETILLTFFACISGIIAGLLVMYGLGTISLNVNSALSMILKDGHLHFKLNPAGIALNFLVILIIALFTAYFPARKAANMSAVDALRHYE